jgi:hypothetical protein
MRRKRSACGLVLVLGLAAAAVAFGAQSAAGSGATIIRGDQLADLGPCPAGDGNYRMAGDLVGCWFTDDFVVRSENPGGGFRASGKEHFMGCLDANGDGTCTGERTGRFDTTFTFTAKLAPSGEEIHGRCQHPIVSGSGAFAGATGVLSFKDIPSEGRFPYHGNIKL